MKSSPFGKNIFNSIAYDVGAVGSRLAGTNNNLAACVGIDPRLINGAFGCNFVQGLNGPAGYGAVRGEDATGHVKTYQVAPPALWGVELHYKFD
jgi:hypothetical protein